MSRLVLPERDIENISLPSRNPNQKYSDDNIHEYIGRIFFMLQIKKIYNRQNNTNRAR